MKYNVKNAANLLIGSMLARKCLESGDIKEVHLDNTPPMLNAWESFTRINKRLVRNCDDQLSVVVVLCCLTGLLAAYARMAGFYPTIGLIVGSLSGLIMILSLVTQQSDRRFIASIKSRDWILHAEWKKHLPVMERRNFPWEIQCRLEENGLCEEAIGWAESDWQKTPMPKALDVIVRDELENELFKSTGLVRTHEITATFKHYNDSIHARELRLAEIERAYLIGLLQLEARLSSDQPEPYNLAFELQLLFDKIEEVVIKSRGIGEKIKLEVAAADGKW